MSLTAAVLPVCLAVLLVTGAVAASEDGVLDIRLRNGIDARIFTADYLAERTETVGDRVEIRLDNGERFTVITDINDPSIRNKGDGEFHPFPKDLVLECLSQIQYPRMNLAVDVFVLPYPRASVLSSSAAAGRIFLSPHVLDISREGAAYIIAHELGHVFQFEYLPDPFHQLWDEYRGIRGIEDETKFSASASHAYRPHEIFAEDFRVLFGGSSAYFDGRVENPELHSPVAVAGLKDFYLQLVSRAGDIPVIVSFENFPNPFNPQTELRVQLTDGFLAMGQRLTVRVYDVSGALVKELYTGVPNERHVNVMWDGRNKHGRQVASSTYFGVVEAGNARMTTKLLMIK
jgi:hypothetical protein